MVAIVGRPNVGKSTLFNRLVGKKLALVDDTPGVTRDRREGDASLGDLSFTVIDTAGLEEADQDSLTGRMRLQTEKALREADVCLFVFDARAGLTPTDKDFADLTRKNARSTLLLANKAEGRKGLDGAYEAFELGLGDPLIISAEHGEGMGDLYSALLERFEGVADGEGEEGKEEDNPAFSDDADAELLNDETPIDSEKGLPLKVAIVGRPNAGKSTLINRMLGDDRLLTGPEAGITRDTIAVDWEHNSQAFRLFDTAGMRRKAKVREKLEKLSVSDALRAIRFAECVVLLMDAANPLEKQDLQIADLVAREGRAIVFGLNKWDTVRNRDKVLDYVRDELDRLLPQLSGAPLVPLSGQTGFGLNALVNAIAKMDAVWNRRVSTAQLNRWLAASVSRHPPPAVSGRRIKLRYLTQVKARPPSFAAFCSRPDALPESYVRYLINGIRQSFDMPGVPIRLALRKRENPYAPQPKAKR
ncbi:MAG: ribosome biogenesis GTPase Der [Pseudomonadota bacterium]